MTLIKLINEFSQYKKKYQGSMMFCYKSTQQSVFDGSLVPGPIEGENNVITS